MAVGAMFPEPGSRWMSDNWQEPITRANLKSDDLAELGDRLLLKQRSAIARRMSEQTL
jgi:hypothetical protein